MGEALLEDKPLIKERFAFMVGSLPWHMAKFEQQKGLPKRDLIARITEVTGATREWLYGEGFLTDYSNKNLAEVYPETFAIRTRKSKDRAKCVTEILRVMLEVLHPIAKFQGRYHPENRLLNSNLLKLLGDFPAEFQSGSLDLWKAFVFIGSPLELKTPLECGLLDRPLELLGEMPSKPNDLRTLCYRLPVLLGKLERE
jgi:hypothetical protein